MFKDYQIKSYFPDGITYMTEHDTKKTMRAKIDSITNVDNQVALYIDANENVLHCMI